MTRFALIALVTFTVAITRAADPAADEGKKLQGEWRVVEAEANGKKAAKDDYEIANMRIVIDGAGITFAPRDGNGKERKKTFKLDPSKSPKEIDTTSLDGKEKDQTAAGIYKLDKDKLTICISKDPTIRPKKFKTDADNGFMVLTLERVKAK